MKTTTACFYTALLLLTGSVCAQALLGFFLGSPDDTWNLCTGQSSAACECPVDTITAYYTGLDCSDKGIGFLHDDLYVPLRFKRVDLSNNHLKNISENTFAVNNTHVTRLDLAANVISAVPYGAFLNLPNLTSLDLSNNEISLLAKNSFLGIAKLSVLDLSHNHLKSLDADLFSLVPNLTELRIKYNPVKLLHDSLFVGLTKLRLLDLTHLQLSTLHYDVFNDTKSLQTLNLAFNDLEYVPTKALFKLSSSLQVLDLSGNYFQELKSYSIYNMEQLHELRLEQLIYLRSIDDFAICETYNLRTISIRLLPRIEFISELAFTSEQNGVRRRIPVQDLSISYTRLERLPEGLVDWEGLKFLELQRNKWRCDCNFTWVKGSVVEERVGDTFYCSSPPRLHGAPLAFLDKSDFVCKPEDNLPDKRQWAAMAVLLVVGMVVSIATVSALFYRRHGFLCRRYDAYNQLSAVSRESITVVDRSNLDKSSMSGTDAEISVG